MHGKGGFVIPTEGAAMTLEEAHRLLVEIVSELKPKSRHPEGVLSADVGWRLAKAGHKGLAAQFGYPKLSAFIEAMCQGPLVVRRDVLGAQDVLIDLADSVAPVETVSRSVVTNGRRGSQSRITGLVSIKPQIWNAVLKGEREIYINEQGHTSLAAPADAENWKQLGMLPAEHQQRILGHAEEIAQDISSTGVREAMMAELKRAQGAAHPLTEFGNVVAGLHQFSKAWHMARIGAVVDFVKASTGLDEDKIMVSTSYRPQMPVQRAMATKVTPTRRTPRPAMRSIPFSEASSPLDEDLRRQLLKQAIDVMPLKDLLELRIPLSADALATLIERDRS